GGEGRAVGGGDLGKLADLLDLFQAQYGVFEVRVVRGQLPVLEGDQVRVLVGVAQRVLRGGAGRGVHGQGGREEGGADGDREDHGDIAPCIGLDVGEGYVQHGLLRQRGQGLGHGGDGRV